MIRTGEVKMRVLFGLFGAIMLLFASRTAAAQQKSSKGGGVITLAEVTIVGRIQKPIASVDVNRIQPKLTLQELRQPFLELVEKAVYQEPF
jgi:hypothetical protein